MHELQKKALEKTIAFLKSINCQYKVVDTDGNIFTNVNEGETFKKRRAKSIYPHGSLTNHIKKYTESLEIGQVITIPIGEFDIDRIGSALTPHLSAKFGNGSYTTHRAKDGVEVLRIS